MEKSCPGKEGHPPSRVNFSERLYEKKVDPFARANSAPACSDCLDRLDGVDPAGRAKVFIWRKVGPARRVTLPSKKGDPARRVTLPAEPTFCFSCKRFAKFCKENYYVLLHSLDLFFFFYYISSSIILLLFYYFIIILLLYIFST